MSTQQPESSVEELAAAYAAARSYRLATLRLRAGYLREFADLWPILAREGDLDRWLRLNVALVRRWQAPQRTLGLQFTERQAQLQGARLRPLRQDHRLHPHRRRRPAGSLSPLVGSGLAFSAICDMLSRQVVAECLDCEA